MGEAEESDRLDALAVVKLVREAGAALPQVVADDETAVLDLLVTERDAAMAEATRLRNQIHQLLLQVEPDYQDQMSSLTGKVGLQVAERYVCTSTKVLDQQRAATIQQLAQRLATGRCPRSLACSF